MALAPSCTGEIGDTAAPARPPASTPAAANTDEPGTSWEDFGSDVVPPSTAPYTPPPSLPSVALCGAQSLGRSYASVLGGAREADRLDHAAGVERHLPIVNTHWYKWELEVPFQKAFYVDGGADMNLAGTVATFNGSREEREFGRLLLGPMTPIKLFQLGFTACVRAISSPPQYSPWGEPKFAGPPTVDGARPVCAELMAKGWSRPGTTEEVESCAALATSVAALESNPTRQWAYLCGAVATAADFVTR